MGNKSSFKKPVSKLSQGQVITTFGPGSIVDAKGDSVTILDIDYWKASDQADYQGSAIYFNKLASYLGVRFFREPRYGKEAIPTVVFPDWHVCTNKKCNLLFRLSESDKFTPEIYDEKGPICPECENKAYPSRFIIFCENGHMDDFPYREYVHKDKKACRGKLRLRTIGRSSSLGDLQIRCDDCDSHRSMGKALQLDEFLESHCLGKHPHRPKDKQVHCEAKVIPSLRGATNVYFSITRSALVIPPWSNPLYQLIEEKLEDINKFVESRLAEAEEYGENIGAEEILKRALKMTYKEMDLDVSFDEFTTIFNKVSAGVSEYKELKEMEYQAITNHGNMTFNEKSMYFKAVDEKVPSLLSKYISKLIRIERVREVLALKGFSRSIYPDPENDSFKDFINLAGNNTGWLPAVRINGEGIFIELNKEQINEWLNSFDSSKITKLYESEYINYLNKKKWEYTSKRNLVYVMLHTLSHVLIRELSFKCGYSSTEMKERIYYGENMCGILIYTGSSDSEGTLGGLEEMGKGEIFVNILSGALEKAITCTGDPSCMNSWPGNGELNGAACHSCVMIPETACENGNRMLDRRTIVPTPVGCMKGYFDDLVREICGIEIL
ncbi:DrmB family protein [Anaerosinus sp.]|uniref:DrmB family protein n=1 Tax=Selenobaculum sp. TaxID=3074374 RepID=UPI003AB1A204